MIDLQIDFPIKRVGSVKADIVLFEDLDEVLELLQEKKKSKDVVL